ncbi:putative thiopurine S-methyltransferase [Oculina patagonica]
MATQDNLEHLATLDFESKEIWEQDWTTDKPEFHSDEVNAMLIKQYNEFTRGRKNLRILVPLCGKSLDMKWLADQGHTVVGVELIRKGIEAFLRDNKLTHHEKSIALSPEIQGTVYKAKEKDITLFECSIFDFSAEVAGGQFDCIWDRGSMTAINMMKDGRVKQYIEIMLACLKPDGRYLLEFFAPESPESMPPSFKFISEKDVNELFGEKCSIRFLGKEKMPDESGESEEHSSDKSKDPAGEADEGTEGSGMLMNYYLMDFK